MKRILCPTDFSPAASNAVAYAAKLAKAFNGSVTLMHVKVLADLTPEEALLGVGWANEDALAERLDNICEEVVRVFKVPCNSTMTSALGSPSDSVDDLIGFDLMVVGTNGEDSRFQAFFGSNAFQIIRKSSIPAIIVPETSLYSEIRRIVYAYDLFERRELPMLQIIRLARSLHAGVTILQVVEETYEKELGAKLESEKRSIQQLYAHDVTIDFDTVHDPDIVEGIQSYVGRENPDILALCVRDNNVYRLLAKSVIKAITAAPKVPLFVFHH